LTGLLVAFALAQERSAIAGDETQRSVEVATRIFCDTENQVERFVALFDGTNAMAAIKRVNEEVGVPNACMVATTAYWPGSVLGVARNEQSTFQIVPITVIGLLTVWGFYEVKPAEYFSIAKVDEIKL
jgi:hypothetical protein